MLDKVYIEKLKSNFNEAVRVILSNKVRTLLTSLGIIFGVAAVITMLAIGNGAEKEILSQLELVGVNNIVITPIPDEKDNDNEEEAEEGGALESKRFSKGLDMLDVVSIQKNIPSVKRVSPEIIQETYVINKGRQNPVKLIGVSPDYFSTANITIDNGKITRGKYTLLKIFALALNVSEVASGALISWPEIAKTIVAMVQQILCGAENWGVFHVHTSDNCSEAEFADAVARLLRGEGLCVSELAITKEPWPCSVERPALLLGRRCTDNFGVQQRSFRVGLKGSVQRWITENGYRPAPV